MPINSVRSPLLNPHESTKTVLVERHAKHVHAERERERERVFNDGREAEDWSRGRWVLLLKMQ